MHGQRHHADGYGRHGVRLVALGLFDNAFGAEVIARPTTSGYVSVVGTLGNCTETDSIYLEVIDPVIDILGADTIFICRGDTVQLMQTNNVGNEGTAVDTPFVIDPMSPNPRVAPITDTEFKATITLPGCRVSDGVFVDVDFLNVPELIAPLPCARTRPCNWPR